MVNLEPNTSHSGTLILDSALLGLNGIAEVCAHDLLNDRSAMEAPADPTVDNAMQYAWQLDSIPIHCTPEKPVLVFRLA